MDSFSKEARSRIMALVKQKNTTPELTVRSALHKLGFRFRLHRKDLPGKPDIVLPKYKTVIFVHGCFWHRHPGCRRSTVPMDNARYWTEKFDRNCKRDNQNRTKLEANGWRVLIVWECESQNFNSLSNLLLELLRKK